MNPSSPHAILATLTVAACMLTQGCVFDGGGDDDESRAGCPADAPDCDRLDGPCIGGSEMAGTSAPGPSPLGLTTSLKENGDYRTWPDGRVPYVIASSVGSTTKKRVIAAMDEWQTMSEQRVRFEQATDDDPAYLRVVAGSPVTSHVGFKKDTVSTVQLRNPEYITVIRHEIGHVLGLHHEHRRVDRLGFITVNPQNVVDSDKCHNQFDVCTDCTDVDDYNVKSVMHYRTSELSSCRVGGKPVLLDLGGNELSFEWLISPKDLLAIEELYGSPPGEAGGAGGAGGIEGVGAESAGTSTGGSSSDGGALGVGGSAAGDATSTTGSGDGVGATTPSSDDASGCAYRAPDPSATRIAWLAPVLAWLVGRRRRWAVSLGTLSAGSHRRSL